MKTCIKCLIKKPVDQFSLKTRTNGRKQRQPRCKSCVNKAKKAERELEKMERLTQYEINELVDRNEGFVFVFNPKPTPTQKRKKEAWNNVLRLLG